MYYANLFLPGGRMLSMRWTVVAGIRLRPAVKRHRSSTTREVTR